MNNIPINIVVTQLSTDTVTEMDDVLCAITDYINTCIRLTAIDPEWRSSPDESYFRDALDKLIDAKIELRFRRTY